MITASLVTYKTRKEDLDRVLGSALGEDISFLYVIDHSPEEGLEQLLPSDPRIVYEKRENLGYGAGHNAAIKKAMEAGSDYHAILNPDIYWEGDVMGKLSVFLENHTNVGMIHPKVLYPDGRLQYTCKLIPTPFDLIASRFLPGFLKKGRMRRFRLEKTGYRKIMDVPYMHGCFMMLRIDTLRDTGLFDERFFMYPEDIDLTRRIHERWKTLFYPNVSIFHAHAAESRKSAKMLWIHATNMVKYFNKWGWLFDSKRRLYNKRLLTEISGDCFGRLSAGSHGQNHRSGPGDGIAAGKDSRS